MSWQQQILFSRCEYEPANQPPAPSRLQPGLSGEYDRSLREKASVRGFPGLPDCLGLEGEYDPLGLVKRVAKALDEQPRTAHIKTLTLSQQGNAIVYRGLVPSEQALADIVQTTRQVDGTHEVATNQVRVAN